MPDREGAARGVFDALGPGGRFVAMTLGAPDLCTPFTLTNGIVARHVTLPKLGPDRPGPVGLSTLDQLEAVLRSAGFVEPCSDRFIAPIFEAHDPAAAWRLFVETAGPFMALLASLSDEQRRATGADVYRRFAEAFPDDPVRPTGEALVVCGVKAIMSVDAEELVDDYLRLGLRFGRLIDGYVDSWTGAPALQEQVAAEAAITPHTKVLEWAAVTFTTGTTMPTRPLAELVHRHGLITLVNGPHLPGQFAFNVHGLGIDFLSGSGSKYQCGPMGTGILYARNKGDPSLQPAAVAGVLAGRLAVVSDRGRSAAARRRVRSRATTWRPTCKDRHHRPVPRARVAGRE